jgi:hypothetical protein
MLEQYFQRPHGMSFSKVKVLVCDPCSQTGSQGSKRLSDLPKDRHKTVKSELKPNTDSLVPKLLIFTEYQAECWTWL